MVELICAKSKKIPRVREMFRCWHMHMSIKDSCQYYRPEIMLIVNIILIQKLKNGRYICAKIKRGLNKQPLKQSHKQFYEKVFTFYTCFVANGI